LQHIRNLEDLGGIAKLMGFTQDGVSSTTADHNTQNYQFKIRRKRFRKEKKERTLQLKRTKVRTIVGGKLTNNTHNFVQTETIRDRLTFVDYTTGITGHVRGAV